MTTLLKRHWLAIVLALVTAALLFGCVHRCATRSSSGADGSPSASSSSPATPATTTSWFASLDWEAIGYAVGAMLTGIGTFYQLVLKFRAGAVTIDAVIDQGKTLFGDVKQAETAFKSPVAKMDQPVTMEKPKS